MRSIGNPESLCALFKRMKHWKLRLPIKALAGAEIHLANPRCQSKFHRCSRDGFDDWYDIRHEIRQEIVPLVKMSKRPKLCQISAICWLIDWAHPNISRINLTWIRRSCLTAYLKFDMKVLVSAYLKIHIAFALTFGASENQQPVAS